MKLKILFIKNKKVQNIKQKKIFLIDLVHLTHF